MKRSSSRQGHRKLFLWVLVGCLALAVGYTTRGILRAGAGPGQLQVPAQGDPSTIAKPEELQAIHNGPHLVYLRQEQPPYGQVNVAGLSPASPRSAQTALRCDRIYYAADQGLCLIYDAAAAQNDPMSPPKVQVMLFGPDFQPRHQFTVEGIPSRTRVSPDG